MRKVQVKYNASQPMLLHDVPARTDSKHDVKTLRAVKELEKTIVVPANIKTVETFKDLQAVGRAVEDAGVMSFDCETNSKLWWKPTSYASAFSIYTPAGTSYFVPTRMVHAWRNFSVEEVQSALFDVFTNPEIGKVNHGIKFDMHFFRSTYGIDIPPESVIHDTLLAQWALDENEDHDLEALSVKYLKERVWKIKQDGSFEVWPMKMAAVYNAKDALNAFRLYEFQLRYLQKLPKLHDVLYSEDMPNLRIMYEAEKRGIGWDTEYFETTMKPIVKTEMAERSAKLREVMGDINFNAPAQVAAALYDNLGVPRIDGSNSTNKETLNRLHDAHPVVKEFQGYKRFATVDKMFVNKLPDFVVNGRIFPSFKVTGTVTGRMSCAEPNLQQIPKSSVGPIIRRGFVPSPGCIFVTFDYSQIELRLLAHESGDEKLIDAFERDLDIHSAVCHDVFDIPYEECDGHPKRTISKNINFGIPYGIGIPKLASFILSTVDEAAEYIGTYFDTYRAVRTYIDRTHKLAYDNGYIETMFGRKRRLPEARSLDRGRAAGALRQAQNAPIQTAAGSIIKRASVRQDELLSQNGWPFELLLQIHDELLYEVNALWLRKHEGVLQVMQQAMCDVVKLRVPVKVSCEQLSRWGDKIVKEDDLIREQFEAADAA